MKVKTTIDLGKTTDEGFVANLAQLFLTGKLVVAMVLALAFAVSPVVRAQSPVKDAPQQAEPAKTIFYCGAPTKKGTPCKHRVKGPGLHCWQHKGAK